MSTRNALAFLAVAALCGACKTGSTTEHDGGGELEAERDELQDDLRSVNRDIHRIQTERANE